MDLLLWRHAEAVDPAGMQDDLERALTPKGERQAARVAAWLNRQLPAGTRILVSPARRAQQTAAALERKAVTAAALAPGQPVDALLQAARWPDARGPVLVVGHQPTLGMCAARLLCGSEQELNVRKAAVWWLRGREREGTLQVTLRAVVGPDQA